MCKTYESMNADIEFTEAKLIEFRRSRWQYKLTSEQEIQNISFFCVDMCWHIIVTRIFLIHTGLRYSSKSFLTYALDIHSKLAKSGVRVKSVQKEEITYNKYIYIICTNSHE